VYQIKYHMEYGTFLSNFYGISILVRILCCIGIRVFVSITSTTQLILIYH